MPRPSARDKHRLPGDQPGARGAPPEAADPASIGSAPTSLGAFCKARGWRLRRWPLGRLVAEKHAARIFGLIEATDALLARLRATDRQLRATLERGRWS